MRRMEKSPSIRNTCVWCTKAIKPAARRCSRDPMLVCDVCQVRDDGSHRSGFMRDSPDDKSNNVVNADHQASFSLTFSSSSSTESKEEAPISMTTVIWESEIPIKIRCGVHIYPEGKSGQMYPEVAAELELSDQTLMYRGYDTLSTLLEGKHLKQEGDETCVGVYIQPHCRLDSAKMMNAFLKVQKLFVSSTKYQGMVFAGSKFTFKKMEYSPGASIV